MFVKYWWVTNIIFLSDYTSNKTVVLSDASEEVQSAGEESTTIVSEYKFGNTWRPDVASQASATGGKQRRLQSPASQDQLPPAENGITHQHSEFYKHSLFC